MSMRGKVVRVAVVCGADGASLQVLDDGGGVRVAGPKAWGNVFNRPSVEFVVLADELVKAVLEHAHKPGGTK